MKKMLLLGFLACAATLSGCSTMQQYATYRTDIFKGKQLMSEGDYKPALEDFIKAAGAMPAEPYPYAFAATASYKMDDIGAAARYIQEAAGRDVQGDRTHPHPWIQGPDLSEAGQGERRAPGPGRLYRGLPEDTPRRTSRKSGICGVSIALTSLPFSSSSTRRYGSTKATSSSIAGRARAGSRSGTAPRRQ